MRTIFVRFYNPNDVMDVTPETTDEEIKEHCFKVNNYENEQGALMAYAETPGTQWSTTLDEDFVNNFMFHHKLYGVEIFDRLVEELNKL